MTSAHVHVRGFYPLFSLEWVLYRPAGPRFTIYLEAIEEATMAKRPIVPRELVIGTEPLLLRWMATKGDTYIVTGRGEGRAVDRTYPPGFRVHLLAELPGGDVPPTIVNATLVPRFREDA